MVKYVASKFQESITTVGCPVSTGCQGVLEPEHCRNILPQQVFDRWGNALFEAVIDDDQKRFCARGARFFGKVSEEVEC
ncbi:hypothetical protein WN943_005761 [Citrus x changshan-huyou]